MTRPTFAVVLALASCPAGQTDPDAQSGDALPACPARDLEVGRCVTATGGGCTGAVGEDRRFAAIAPGDELASIVGPQGAAMFVLAARTIGIAGGDPDDPASPDNPVLEISVVTSAGAQVARYLGRSAFVDDGAAQLAAGLFVVLDGDRHAGDALRAHGVLVDATGARRCGEAAFVAR